MDGRILAAVPPTRPTPAELVAARERTIPDVLSAGLEVVFCGINPGLWSAATGHHFARPGNRFWPALHRSGFTPRQLRPDEQDQLPEYGLGITNLVDRASARADELTRDELAAGGVALRAKIRRYRPEWLAVCGVVAYRTAFGVPAATMGCREERMGSTRIWVLPNPSGLNAHYTLDKLAAEFAALRERVTDGNGSPGGQGPQR